MNTILVGAELTYQVNQHTSFLLHFSVAQNAFQRVVNESTLINQDSQLILSELGNRCYRIVAPPGQLTLTYTAEVVVTPSIVAESEIEESQYQNLPAEILTYLNPSRYCESERLGRFAQKQFGSVEPGLARVDAICDWIYENVSYIPDSTDVSTTACDVLVERAGVCRDFAHVGISLCRALGIPARYISGYALDLQPPDFHGFFEAYLGGQWFLFDATRLAPVSGLVRIGTGHDAADVAFATLVGNALLTAKQVWANQGVNANDSDNRLEQAADGSGISTT